MRHRAIVASLVLTLPLLLRPAPAQEPKPGLAIAQQGLEAVYTKHEHGTADVEELARWSHRVVDESGGSAAAWAEHEKRMKKLVEDTSRSREVGSRSELDVITARWHAHRAATKRAP